MRYKIAILVLNRVWLSISYRTLCNENISRNYILAIIIRKFSDSDYCFIIIRSNNLNETKKKIDIEQKKKYIIQEGLQY